MQQFKSKLTRLRGVFERLPETGDVYGYAGITRQMLLSAIDGIYALANDIHESDENRLIVIALKRRGAKFYDRYKTILDSETDVPSLEVFDRFLDDVSELFERTKNVCSICRSGSEDAAVELAQLKDNVEEFKKFVASYDVEYTKAKDAVEQLEKYSADAGKLSGDIQKAHTSSLENGTAIASAKEQIEKSAEEIDSWHAGIEDCEKRIAVAEKSFSEMRERVDVVTKEAAEIHKKSSKGMDDIDALHLRSKRLLDESQDTLASANRHSMSASFDLRRKELLKPMCVWGCALLLAMAGIAAVVIWGPELDFSRGFGMNVFGPLIFRFALIAPCVWLGWFAGTQYGYTVRVREDYSFKYACSVAYEGYKKAVGEDSVLGKILLELCMLNMAQQPLRVYAGNKFGVKGLPIEELLDDVMKHIPHTESLDIKCGSTNLKAQFSQPREDAKNGDNRDLET